MKQNVIDYYGKLPEAFHFIRLQDYHSTNQELFRIDPSMGTGTSRIIKFANPNILILSMDVKMNDSFEKVMDIADDFVEITCLEENDYKFKIGSRNNTVFESGIHFYVSNHRPTYSFAEKETSVVFTRIILAKEYFDQDYLRDADITFEHLKANKDLLNKNAKNNTISFIFQQIINCQAEGQILELYLEEKIAELLITALGIKEEENEHISVRLGATDIRGLKRTITYMKGHLDQYPSNDELATIALMSGSRYMLAFKKYYGTTPYSYLKEQRMNQALLLLKNPSLSIKAVADLVGYTKSGHFSKLFKETYGITPKEYRSFNNVV